MNFSAITQRSVLRKPGESSPLWSPREPNAIGNLWKPANGGLYRDDNLTNQISALQAQVRELQRHQRKLGSGMHPFKIYNFPKHLRRFQNENDWRRFKVRGGQVFYGEPGGALSAGRGTDNATLSFEEKYGIDLDQIPPSDDSAIVEGYWNEVIVPADGVQYYFWYSWCLAGLLTSGSPDGVMFGSDAADALSLETGEDGIVDPWPGFPIEDPYHRVIGSVRIMPDDSLPGTPPNTPMVKQFINSDLRFTKVGAGIPGIGVAENFRGTWAADQYYYNGDCVTQIVTASGFDTLNHYCLFPPNGSAKSGLFGAILNVDPSNPANVPDPWRLTASSKTSADYRTGAFDAAKYYLRTA